MANANPICIDHKTTDLLRAPFVYHLANQAWQSFSHCPSAMSALITWPLGLFRRITNGQTAAFYLATNGASVDAKGLGDLSMSDAGLKIGKNLVSLDLEQLSAP